MQQDWIKLVHNIWNRPNSSNNNKLLEMMYHLFSVCGYFRFIPFHFLDNKNKSSCLLFESKYGDSTKSMTCLLRSKNSYLQIFLKHCISYCVLYIMVTYLLMQMFNGQHSWGFKWINNSFVMIYWRWTFVFEFNRERLLLTWYTWLSLTQSQVTVY